MENSLTRRDLLSGAVVSALATSACSRALATRYFGWLLVASAAEKAINVADLSEFRRTTTIPLGETPAQILQAGERVYVTCPDAKLLIELDKVRFGIRAKIQMTGRIVGAVVTESGAIALATTQPAQLVVVSPKSGAISRRIPLGVEPSSLDTNGEVVAVASEASGQIIRVSLRSGSVLGTSILGEPCGSMRFRRDGQSILAALPGSRQIVTLDAVTGSLLARLPMRFPPGRFCFNADGGQMFVTAIGEDAVVIVSPFQSQIDQTIVAGRKPYGMVVSALRNLLLITNPESGDVTILDIETRRLAASVHVGGEPGEVLLTADEEYALVLSRDAGDVAVIRMKTVLDKAVHTKPMLTMFPMGGAPQSALIVPRDA